MPEPRAASLAARASSRGCGQFGDSYGIAFQHADDRDDREHAAFAAEARRRIHELVTEATATLDGLGEKAAPLRALALKLDASAAAGQ